MSSTENARSVEELMKVFQKWKKIGKKCLTFLVLGVTGVGKTSLINTLLSKDIAPIQNYSSEADTKQLERYTGMVNGVEVTPWDSRGLRDGEGIDEYSLRDMLDKIKEIDPYLIIHCHRMDLKRLLPDDKESLKLVTSYLGDGIWAGNTVIALTYADKVEDDKYPENNVRYFNKEH